MLSRILFWNNSEKIIAPNIPKPKAIRGLTFKNARSITSAGIKNNNGEI